MTADGQTTEESMWSGTPHGAREGGLLCACVFGHSFACHASTSTQMIRCEMINIIVGCGGACGGCPAVGFAQFNVPLCPSTLGRPRNPSLSTHNNGHPHEGPRSLKTSGSSRISNDAKNLFHHNRIR
jgi:hypothetical protein